MLLVVKKKSEPIKSLFLKGRCCCQPLSHHHKQQHPSLCLHTQLQLHTVHSLAAFLVSANSGGGGGRNE